LIFPSEMGYPTTAGSLRTPHWQRLRGATVPETKDKLLAAANPVQTSHEALNEDSSKEQFPAAPRNETLEVTSSKRRTGETE
jgi:hypothetical protein